MIKKWIFIFLVLFPAISFGEQYLESIPNNCFTNGIYCSHSKVVKKVVDGSLKQMINVEIYLSLSTEDYFNENEILDLFYDFGSWGRYASQEGSESIRFYNTMELDPIEKDGITIRRQYLHYDIRAPRPVTRTTIEAVGHYWQIPSVDGALATVQFKHLTEGNNYIPGVGVLIGCRGLKYTAGIFHIYYDKLKKNFLVTFSADVIPEASFLLNVAASYVENGFLSIMKGMFGL